ncbi:10197_t:CDS:2 [Funneliformis mosseae]|uniref:10197_t:CDS:1 n=1 Tax=Funneliformis mosseae TaxID=27381 RepID=A0A9N8ZDY6_FUNMO|nr:10197_t:CDS:2 [Funneliformis mosseae]
MENIYHKFILDHLSEMNPTLFFDHFKFAYAKKSTAQQLLANSLGYLQNYVNDPAIRSLAQEKRKDLKKWRESQYAIEYWQGIERKEAEQKVKAAAKISELHIEATLHKDTIHHSSAVSNLTRNKLTALNKRPNTDVDSENNPFIVTEDLEPIDSHTTPSSHTDSEDLEHNPFIVTKEQKEGPEPTDSLTPLNFLKRPKPLLDIEMDLDWAPWKYNLIINNIDIEQILQNIYKKCQKTRPKTKTSLDYGIIDLNDGVVLEGLGKSIKLYFEARIQDYKPKKNISKEIANCLKKFNVTSLKDLGKALSEVHIDYDNLDRDIFYLHRLFQKFSELQEGWYNSHIVAPIFDECLESVDEWILRRGEVENYAQKFLDRTSRKRKKYDGILSFSRQFEFIYVETTTTSILSKTENDLSKLHQAIILMFKLMVSTLPEKMLEEISSMPVLCVQFSGASAEVYLANWPKNMRPIVFSIMKFDIPEEVTALPKLTKVAAKMLSLRSYIQNLNNKYQVLLMKMADYYLNEDNDWDSPIKLKARC